MYYFLGTPPRKPAVSTARRVHPNIVTSLVILKAQEKHSASDNNGQTDNIQTHAIKRPL